MRVLPVFIVLVLASIFMQGRLASQSEEQILLWKSIKEALLGQNGKEYFEKNMKGAKLPILAGTLVSSKPAAHPSEFLVAMDDDKTAEVKLKLDKQLEKPLQPGTPVSFEGVAEEFTTEPLMVTFDVTILNRATVDDRKSPPQKKSN
jgi:hypothetical protein